MPKVRAGEKSEKEKQRETLRGELGAKEESTKSEEQKELEERKREKEAEKARRRR